PQIGRRVSALALRESDLCPVSGMARWQPPQTLKRGLSFSRPADTNCLPAVPVGCNLGVFRHLVKRSGEYGAGGICGTRPPISSAISFPVAAARLKPSMLCPVAR